MTEIPTSNFADVYSQQRQAITGVAFFLIPYKKGQIVWTKLMEMLNGKFDIQELYEEDLARGLKEGEKLYIPDVFKNGASGRIILKTSIDKVALTGSSLFGKATLDKPLSWSYRGFRIIIIATTEIHFLICQDEKIKRHYLVILGSRVNSQSLFGRLNNFLQKVGLFAVPAGIDSDKIDGVREELHGELLDTTLDGFSTPKIKMKRIIGKGFQDEASYLIDVNMSSIHQHMFAYNASNTPKSPRKVVTISEDALVRFYSATTYDEYEWFLRRYIFPILKQIEQPPTVPLIGFSAPEDIFKEVTEQEE